MGGGGRGNRAPERKAKIPGGGFCNEAGVEETRTVSQGTVRPQLSQFLVPPRTPH